MTTPELLSADQAAERINRSSRAIRRAAERESIGTRISGTWVFTEADLDRLKAATQDGAGQPKKTPAEKSPARKRKKKR